MRRRYTKRFLRSYASAPVQIQQAFDKQALLLLQNVRHPSLRAKKYHAAQEIWQARITKNGRCYFTVEGDTFTFLDLIPHPK